jgi:hypothetical protein
MTQDAASILRHNLSQFEDLMRKYLAHLPPGFDVNTTIGAVAFERAVRS